MRDEKKPQTNKPKIVVQDQQKQTASACVCDWCWPNTVDVSHMLIEDLFSLSANVEVVTQS